VTVVGIKNGVLFRMPDGQSTAAVHYTGSDHRGPANLRSALKRAGIDWPTDGAHRQKSKPSKATRLAGEMAMSRLGWPMETTTAKVMAAWDGSPARTSVGRFLTDAGYDLVGHARGARWVRYEIPERFLNAEHETVPDTGQDTDMTDVANDLEFLDTRDSWTIATTDLAAIPFGHVQAVLAAAGLDMELRVWKP
jgi:hypothetical protein